MKWIQIKWFLMLITIIQMSCQLKQKYVSIQPANGTLDLVTVSGELGKRGRTEMYLITFINERHVTLEEGFVIVKLHRIKGDDVNAAYKLLDSLNLCTDSFRAQIDGPSSFSQAQKERIRRLRALEISVRERFHRHVKFIIEQSALETGISRRAVLNYE